MSDIVEVEKQLREAIEWALANGYHLLRDHTLSDCGCCALGAVFAKSGREMLDQAAILTATSEMLGLTFDEQDAFISGFDDQRITAGGGMEEWQKLGVKLSLEYKAETGV